MNNVFRKYVVAEYEKIEREAVKVFMDIRMAILSNIPSYNSDKGYMLNADYEVVTFSNPQKIEEVFKTLLGMGFKLMQIANVAAGFIDTLYLVKEGLKIGFSGKLCADGLVKYTFDWLQYKRDKHSELSMVLLDERLDISLTTREGMLHGDALVVRGKMAEVSTYLTRLRKCSYEAFKRGNKRWK